MAAAKPHKIFPHGTLEPLAQNLWRVVGSLPFPLKRNMIVHKLADGGLLLYSVVALDEAGMKSLEQLGRPTVIVVPHPFHIMDLPFYKARYPEAQVLGAADAQVRCPSVKFDGSPEEALARRGIGAHVIPGMKYSEVVLELPVGGAAGATDGRALVFTDLVGEAEGRPGLLMRLLGPPGGRGVARIVKLRQVSDKDQVRGFLRKMAATPSLEVVTGCHGGFVTRDCQGWLSAAADGV